MNRMKHTLFNLLTILAFASGCSPSENPQEEVPKEPFFQATFLSETYSNFYSDAGWSYPENCTTGERDLKLNSIGRIELTNVLLQANFIVPKLLSNWGVRGSIPDSRVVGNHIRGGCHNSFDLEITFKIDSEVQAVESSLNFNRIEKVLFISEDPETASYMFEGYFMVTFKDVNGSLLPVEGKYTIPVVFNKI